MRSVLTALCLFTATAHAVPAQFTHQGRLLDADGIPLEGDATIKFRVTDSEEGGTVLWEETLTLPLTGGFYAAVLGASDDNPLDTDVLSQAPVWLELQLDGEPAMFPRSAINAVPYATMATVAEEVSGGPVDASQIAVDGTPVVNELGEWVGPAPTVNWSDIEGMPEDFADGVDDDTDTDTDSFAALGTSCLDGDIAVWDGVAMDWVCDLDRDTLADLACTDGQLIAWSDESTGFVCADDADTVLTEDEVDAMVADNGYAMASEVFSTSFLDLTDVPDGLLDGDDDTQLTEEQVDAMVSDNGYAMTSEVFSGSFLDLVDVAPGLADGDDDTQLTEDEVDAMVADNGYAMATDIFSGSFSDLTGVPAGLTDGDDDSDLLATLDCAGGEIAVFNESTLLWDCTALSSGSSTQSISAPSLESTESISFSLTEATAPAVIQAWRIDDAGTWHQIDHTSRGSDCDACGAGSDGESVSGGILSGQYDFSVFSLAEGSSIECGGASPVIIRSQSTVTINGTIDLSGSSGSGTSGAGGACGGYGGGGGSTYYSCCPSAGGGPGGGAKASCGGGSGRAGNNGAYTAGLGKEWWVSSSNFNPLNLEGGSGGGGGCYDYSGRTGGGGGAGGGVLMISAPRIVVAGELSVAGGSGGTATVRGGNGSGGAIWLRAASVDISGTVNVGSGVLRIDAHEVHYSGSYIAGDTARLPALLDVKRNAIGTVELTNLSSNPVNAVLTAVQ